MGRKKLAALIIVGIFLGAIYLAYPQRYVLMYPYTRLVPYHHQDTDYYCAEACIQMLLEFHGIVLPSQDTLAYEAKYDSTNKTTYAREMPNPFLNRGLHVSSNTTRNYEWAYENLMQRVKTVPVIVLIKWDKGPGHYFVVFRVERAGVTHHDPYYGPDRFSDYNTFRRLWFDNRVSDQLLDPCWILIVWRFQQGN